MKSKSFMLMILSMGFGLIAAIGISQVMGRSKNGDADAPKMGPVLLAADHLNANSKLTEENVKIENWPLELIHEDAATSLDDIKDLYIRERMSKGMPLLKTSIVTEHELNRLPIPNGLRVVSFKVSGDSYFGGLLGPGDKVDVIGLFELRGRNGSKQTITRTFLKALDVFNVNNKTSAADNREESGSGASAIVGVLVTPKQAEELIFVLKTGSVQLSLRSDEPADDEEVESIADLMDFGLDSNVAADIQPTPSEIPPIAGFPIPNSQPSAFQSTNSMIVWNGNSPEKVIFSANSVPQRVGPANAPAPQVAPMGPSPQPNDREDGEDFNDSNEIDRNLEQDQYRGE